MTIALIGPGKWGKKIIKKINDLNYSVKTFCSKDNFKKEINNFNTIFITTSDQTHFKYLNLLKNTNKKIFCEKPLTRNKKELIKLKKFKFKSIFISDISNYYPNFKIKDNNLIYRSKKDNQLIQNSKKRFDLLYRFLYHDIGYLITKLKFKKIENIKIINSKRFLELSFFINKKFFHFKYETNKNKKYTFNFQDIYTNKDILKTMIKDFLNDQFNHRINLEKSFKILEFLEIIKLKIKKNSK